MRIVVVSAFALALGPTVAVAAPPHVWPGHAALRRAAPPQQALHPFDVKPGTELTIPISIVDGKVVAGVPRLATLGAGKPAAPRSWIARSLGHCVRNGRVIIAHKL